MDNSSVLFLLCSEENFKGEGYDYSLRGCNYKKRF